jgi:hypothetical protein
VPAERQPFGGIATKHEPSLPPWKTRTQTVINFLVDASHRGETLRNPAARAKRTDERPTVVQFSPARKSAGNQ